MAERGIGSYIPSQINRFEVSSDPYSQARKIALDETVQVLVERYSFFGGATLFGSLSKGKYLTTEIASNTDVDINLFYDTSKAITFLELDPECASQPKNWEEIESGAYGNGRIPKQIRDCLADLGEVLENAANELFAETQPKELPQAKLSAYPGPISANYREMGSLNWTLGERDIAVCELHMDYKCLDYAVAAPFGMAVGNSLTEYHSDWFEKIRESQYAEDTWSHKYMGVRSIIRRWERNDEIPPALEKFYPMTLAEAIKYYCK